MLVNTEHPDFIHFVRYEVTFQNGSPSKGIGSDPEVLRAQMVFGSPSVQLHWQLETLVAWGDGWPKTWPKTRRK